MRSKSLTTSYCSRSQCFTFGLTKTEASTYKTSFRREKKDPQKQPFFPPCHWLGLVSQSLYSNFLSPHDNPVLISSVLLLWAISFMSHILPASKVPFRSIMSCESYQLPNTNRVSLRHSWSGGFSSIGQGAKSTWIRKHLLLTGNKKNRYPTPPPSKTLTEYVVKVTYCEQFAAVSYNADFQGNVFIIRQRNL